MNLGVHKYKEVKYKKDVKYIYINILKCMIYI